MVISQVQGVIIIVTDRRRRKTPLYYILWNEFLFGNPPIFFKYLHIRGIGALARAIRGGMDKSRALPRTRTRRIND